MSVVRVMGGENGSDVDRHVGTEERLGGVGVNGRSKSVFGSRESAYGNCVGWSRSPCVATQQQTYESLNKARMERLKPAVKCENRARQPERGNRLISVDAKPGLPFSASVISDDFCADPTRGWRM